MQPMPLAVFQQFGFAELLIILFIILLLFGARRLPEMMRSMGKGVKEFKKGIKEAEEEGEGRGDRGDDRTPPPA
ncbi:MAG: twin-arginine translocase TatA/TatE family subunit [bacterium]|nr:twin-arginine translocase TatA/TatE family subunit [bacterium]